MFIRLGFTKEIVLEDVLGRNASTFFDFYKKSQVTNSIP